MTAFANVWIGRDRPPRADNARIIFLIPVIGPTLLKQLWESGAGRLSVQVLQEFYGNVTRKLAAPVARSTAREVIRTYGTWVHEPTTPETVIRAIEIAELAQIMFWDALIVASAQEAQATQMT